MLSSAEKFPPNFFSIYKIIKTPLILGQPNFACVTFLISVNPYNEKILRYKVKVSKFGTFGFFSKIFANSDGGETFQNLQLLGPRPFLLYKLNATKKVTSK